MIEENSDIYISSSLYGVLKLSTNVQDQAIASVALKRGSVHPE